MQWGNVLTGWLAYTPWIPPTQTSPAGEYDRMVDKKEEDGVRKKLNKIKGGEANKN